MVFARFRNDDRGSVVPTFVIASAAIFGFVGAAVDYTRASAVRTELQNAIDATALILSKDADKTDPALLPAKAHDLFFDQFKRPEAKNVTVDAHLTTPQQGSFRLTVTANATVDTVVTRAIGSSMNIGSSTEVAWGIKKLEIALVLDNTGSMAQNHKLEQLKTAAHNMLTTLQNAGKQPGDVKVAIIPFDRMVNIGTGFKDEFWVDYSVKGIKKANWNGCVIDRDQPNDTLDTTPVATNFHTFYPADTCGTLTQAMPLSTNWDALNTKIDQMTASGNTNTTIGLMWGWHALTAGLPFTEAAAPAPDLDKVIVLLTDGDNTQNRWSTRSSTIDARMAEACNQVRLANIKVYTVRVIDGNASLLRSCATTTNMYYDVQQADQLNGVFSSIAQSLASLRLSR
jgi:Flp pilus assembly protein TadG